MNIQQIADAVDAGQCVHWKNEGYIVIPCRYNGYLIVWDYNGQHEDSIGLMWQDGKTLNGKEEDFYIQEGIPCQAQF